MFKLTELELENAFTAINHHGYSTMIPEPLEWQVVKNNWQQVKDELESIDLDTYHPEKPLKIFSPKSRANIRVIHLLHPKDLIIYTALTMIVKNDIEAGRLSQKTRRVFSYRINPAQNGILYITQGAHEKYLMELDEKSAAHNVRFVGITDIADFYPRVYQHRLENIIESISLNTRGKEVARVLVKKMISFLMERNSYGIPIGPYASRVLGEAILIDVDSYLHTNKVNFVRWVDDYNIFGKSESEVQNILFKLGEWLFNNHGLTLQTSKTKILTVEKYREEILTLDVEDLSDRENILSILKSFKDTYDDDDTETVLDQEEIDQLIETNLTNLLQQSITDTSLVDYEMITYLLDRLPRIPDIPEETHKEMLHIITANAEILYPLAEYMAKYIISFESLSLSEKREISKRLLKPLKSKTKPPDFYAMWIMHIFSTSPSWNQIADILGIYQSSTSEVLRRYAALAISVAGSRNEVLAIKNDYHNSSALNKLALLMASRKMGSDERHHWKLSCQVKGVIEKAI